MKLCRPNTTIFLSLITSVVAAVSFFLSSSPVNAQATCDAYWSQPMANSKFYYPVNGMTVIPESDNTIPLRATVGAPADGIGYKIVPAGKDCSAPGAVCSDWTSKFPKTMTLIPGVTEYELWLRGINDYCIPVRYSQWTIIRFTIGSGVLPTPTPPATPLPTAPPLSPACLSITKDVAAPKVGDNVTFTCGTVPTADRYEFRYKAGTGALTTLASSSTTPNISVPLAITQAAHYSIQCRPCLGAQCTDFEAIQ